MNWLEFLELIKSELGYSGEETAEAVESFLKTKGKQKIVVDGAPVDYKSLYTAHNDEDGELDLTATVKERKAAARLKELEEENATLKETVELTGKNKGTKGTGGRITATNAAIVGKDRLADDPLGGFKSVSEFIMEVKEAGGNNAGPGAIKSGSKLDLYTKAALSTYGNEGTGADGGFAVIPEFRSEIDIRVSGEASLLARCTVDPVSGNSLTVPQDETTPWQTTGGIQAEWEGEAGTITQSKPQLKAATRRLRKVTALVPLTDELMQDAPAMANYVSRKAPEKMGFKIDEAIIRGTGVGMPLGILNSAALITVSKESSQPADTIKATNVQKMYMRMYAPYRRNSIWLINQDVEVQLQQMVVVGKTDAGTSIAVGGLVYIPPGTGLSGDQYGTLLGRPVIPTQHAETLGDVSDIMLVDLSQYWAIRKASGLEMQSSIHFWFDQSITAFRFVQRLDGGPFNSTTISPRDGSNTMSAFIALEAR